MACTKCCDWIVVQVGTQLFLCWFLYYYTAAALRESVLRMNGSHIRPW